MPDEERGRLWVLVTDGHRARIVEPAAAEGRFHTSLRLGVVEPPYCPPPLRHETSHLHHHQFVHDIAKRLNEEASENAFDELILVAPSAIGHDIRAALNGAARARLVSLLGHDYEGLDDAALSTHLARWWAPPRTERNDPAPAPDLNAA